MFEADFGAARLFTLKLSSHSTSANTWDTIMPDRINFKQTKRDGLWWNWPVGKWGTLRCVSQTVSKATSWRWRGFTWVYDSRCFFAAVNNQQEKTELSVETCNQAFAGMSNGCKSEHTWADYIKLSNETWCTFLRGAERASGMPVSINRDRLIRAWWIWTSSNGAVSFCNTT